MSELVALCFDADASPRVRVGPPGEGRLVAGRGAPEAHGTSAIYGWGLAWYPSSERGASVIKDPTSSGESAVSSAIGDWRRFRSTIFVCHLRGHRRPRNQEDAQPFVRSYGGRQWVFAHDGDLALDWGARFPLPDDPAFDPLGRTDSEHAFCWLLARMHADRARSLADIAPERLHGWLRELNAGGQVNAILTDGERVAIYHDMAGRGELYCTRRIPPHATSELASDGLHIALDAPEDPNRTGLVVSSVPLSSDAWQPASPGELLVARRGTTVWSSSGAGQAQAMTSGRAAAPPGGQVETGWQTAASEPLAVSRDVASTADGFAAPGRAPTPGTGTRILGLVHRTSYVYELPVERSSHRLLLRPLEDRGQQLLEFSVETQPPLDIVEFEDVFGNAAMAVEIHAPFSELQITSRATVRVQAPHTLEQRAAHARHAIPLVWMPWQRQMLSAYLLPPELPETQLQELSAFAMSFVERNDYDLVGTLLDLNETIYRDFEYVSDSTTNETTAFEVYESRRGVCQDFANLMICLARLLQIPARYRMGYIFTGGDYPNKIQSDASHAWLELYLPRVGWHGFDPTNGIQVGADHIRVACGRNFRDATPTSGTIYRGGGTETLRISVRVAEREPGSS